MVTNGFAPEFGRSTGGLLNVVTKSGTNQVHGTLHEYYRGKDLTAHDALGIPRISRSSTSSAARWGGRWSRINISCSLPSTASSSMALLSPASDRT